MATSTVDEMFTPAGFAVALTRGCELSVDVGRSSVTLTADDLTCADCGGPFDTPKRGFASWIAANKVLNDGLCGGCDGG